MEVVGAPSGPLLHCASPMQPRDFSFSSYTFSPFLFLSSTNTREHTCLRVHHHAYSLHVNGNPGNLLTSPSGTFDRSLTNICGGDPIYPISSPAHPSRPLVSSYVFCSSEPIRSTWPQLLFQFVIINPLFCRNPATCVFSLLLSDAPFTDRAVFSIQGQCLVTFLL